MIRRIAAVVLWALMATFGGNVWAQSWESNFGPVLDALTTEDDEQTDVMLDFPFPFEGTNYTTVYVGTNGDVQLGGLGDDNDIDYDHWEYMWEFISDQAPSIAGFNTDLDLSSTGTIHYNGSATRAVFTWNEVGTNQNELALISFQIQLYPDGTVAIVYNGVLDDASEDLINDLDEGIVVGISDGLWPRDNTEPGLSDLSASIPSGSANLYDRWCYDTANSCGFDGSDDGLPGPVNTAFDLDFQSVVFTPLVGGGFAVSQPLSGGAVGIPAMGYAGLILLSLLVSALGVRRLRRV